MKRFLSIINNTDEQLGKKTGSDLNAIGEAIIALSELRASGTDHNLKYVTELDTLPDNWSPQAKAHAETICKSLAIEMIDNPDERHGPNDCPSIKQNISIHFVFEEEGTKVIPIAPASSFAKGLQKPPMEVPNFYVDDFLRGLILKRQNMLTTALETKLSINDAEDVLQIIADTLEEASNEFDAQELFQRQLGAYSISQCR